MKKHDFFIKEPFYQSRDYTFPDDILKIQLRRIIKSQQLAFGPIYEVTN